VRFAPRGQALPKALADAVAKVTGAASACMIVPVCERVQMARDRSEQLQRNLYLAFALEAYHADHGTYPAKLNELAPKYIAAIPNDIFSGKPLIYRQAENGYLLYSVGPNCRDDDGRNSGDNPPGDDLAIRMPLPEVKTPK
jgi:hypothetical protein